MSEQKLIVPPRSVFAAVLLEATESPRPDKGPDWPTIVDLTNRVVELKKRHHLDTSDISIRADRGGWTSDDLWSFVNGFVLFGLATQRPITLAPEARRLCEKILLEDGRKYPQEIDELKRAVRLRSVGSQGVAPVHAWASGV
jgi:hypothetical protein